MTSLFLLNIDQEVVKIVPSKDILELWQDMGVNEVDTINATLILSKELVAEMGEVFYVGISDIEDKHAFNLYRILTKETTMTEIRLRGIQLAFDELEGKGYIKDLRPKNESFSSILTRVLQGSGWTLGYVDSNLPNVTTNLYYLNRLDSIAEIINVTGAELKFKVAISDNKITEKYVEAYMKIGRDTGKRFVYGANSLEIVAEEDIGGIYTSAVGRGRGEEISSAEDNPSGQIGYGRKITFEDVEWKKSNGHPVDKPLGQEWIEIPEATEMFGYPDGNARNTLLEFPNVTDPEQLIWETYRELLELSRPKVQFKTKVDNIGLSHYGDTVTIVRYDIDLKYQARIFKVRYNRLNLGASELDIGDVVLESSAKKQARFRKEVSRNIEQVNRDIENTYIMASDGTRVNYGVEEPSTKKVNDIWFETLNDGSTRIRVWDGNQWVIEIDTSDITKNADAIAEQQQGIEEAKQTADEAVEQIDTAVANAGFTSLSDTLIGIKSISDSAQENSITALGDAQTALSLASGVHSDVASIDLRVDEVEGTLLLKADSQSVDTLTGRVTLAETNIGINAQGLALKADQSTVDTLAGTVSSLGTEVDVVAGQISSKVWSTDIQTAIDDTTALINHVESELTQKHDSITATVSSIDGRVATNELNLDGAITRVGNAEGKITTIETNVSGLQTTVASKASQTQVTQLANGLSSVVTDLSNLEIGGRNYFGKSDFENPTLSGVSGYIYGGEDYVNGFIVTGGNNGRTGYVQFDNIVPENGTYTFSFKMRGTQNSVNHSVRVNICGAISQHIYSSTDNEYNHFSFTAKVDNWSESNNWVKIESLNWLYYRFDDVKLEKGNKATDWTPAPEDIQSQITQNATNINLRVAKGELLSQINIEADRQLFQSGKILFDAENVVFTGTAWIPSSVIGNLEADKITSGTFDGAKARIINLDFDTAVGNRTNFVQSAWNSAAGGNVNVTGSGIVSTANDGSQVYIQNGIVGARTASGHSSGHIGNAPLGYSSNDFAIQTSWGSKFQLYQVTGRSSSSTTYQHTLLISPDTDSDPGGRIDLKTTNVNVFSNMSVGNSLSVNNRIYMGNNIEMQGNDVVGAYGMNMLNGDSRIYTTTDSLFRLQAGPSTIMQFRIGGAQKFRIDSTRNYSSQILNMQGNQIVDSPSVSDLRLKDVHGIRTDNDLEKLIKIEYVDFRWKDEEYGGQDLGFVAQQVQNVAPEIITEVAGGMLGFNQVTYLNFIGHSVQQLALRELNTNQVASQALQLGETNEEKIKRLEKRIEELESVM